MKAQGSLLFPALMLVLCIAVSLPVWAVDPAAPTAAAQTPAKKPGVPAVSGAAVATSTEKPSVPNAYRTITLGMDIDAVKGELLADPLYGYRGERDVSLLPGENRSLIETSGPSFIRRAWFQFYDGNLYIMTFTLDPEKIDYYSMYSKFVEKYGEPVSLDPRKAVWGDDKTTLSLERPLTVKYVDVKVFTDLLGKSGTEKAQIDKERERFINDF